MDRGLLWRTYVAELGMEQGLVGQLQQLYVDLRVTLTGGSDLPDIPVRAGLKQGCPCSPLLFSILFDRVSAWVHEAASHVPHRGKHFVRCLVL